jgi:hypothetical protein
VELVVVVVFDHHELLPPRELEQLDPPPGDNVTVVGIDGAV